MFPMNLTKINGHGKIVRDLQGSHDITRDVLMKQKETTNERDLFSPFILEPSWRSALSEELAAPYLRHLAAFVERERRGEKPVYPPEQLVFNAFWRTPFSEVKVVIVGQDPYHGVGQAHGLSFSVPEGVPPPPSLQNIFKEIQADLDISKVPSSGSLLSWAEQGVFLLNALLTVRQGEPLSHQGKGWEAFTDRVIKKLLEREDPMVFLLWGKSAKEKCNKKVDPSLLKRHLILTAAHPSPLSAHQGFFGCRHFSQANAFLEHQGKTAIQWL